MRLRGKDFDKMHYDNRILLLNSKGVKVTERKLFAHQSIVLFSINNFFVEAIINNFDNKILGIERLDLEEVSERYCKEIPY